MDDDHFIYEGVKYKINHNDDNLMKSGEMKKLRFEDDEENKFNQNVQKAKPASGLLNSQHK